MGRLTAEQRQWKEQMDKISGRQQRSPSSASSTPRKSTGSAGVDAGRRTSGTFGSARLSNVSQVKSPSRRERSTSPGSLRRQTISTTMSSRGYDSLSSPRGTLKSEAMAKKAARDREREREREEPITSPYGRSSGRASVTSSSATRNKVGTSVGVPDMDEDLLEDDLGGEDEMRDSDLRERCRKLREKNSRLLSRLRVQNRQLLEVKNQLQERDLTIHQREEKEEDLLNKLHFQQRARLKALEEVTAKEEKMKELCRVYSELFYKLRTRRDGYTKEDPSLNSHLNDAERMLKMAQKSLGILGADGQTHATMTDMEGLSLGRPNVLSSIDISSDAANSPVRDLDDKVVTPHKMGEKLVVMDAGEEMLTTQRMQDLVRVNNELQAKVDSLDTSRLNAEEELALRNEELRALRNKLKEVTAENLEGERKHKEELSRRAVEEEKWRVQVEATHRLLLMLQKEEATRAAAEEEVSRLSHANVSYQDQLHGRDEAKQDAHRLEAQMKEVLQMNSTLLEKLEDEDQQRQKAEAENDEKSSIIRALTEKNIDLVSALATRLERHTDTTLLGEFKEGGFDASRLKELVHLGSNEEKLALLSAKVTDLISRLQEVEKSNADLQTEVSTKQSEVDAISMRNRELQRNFKEETERREECEREISNLHGELSASCEKNIQLLSDIEKEGRAKQDAIRESQSLESKLMNQLEAVARVEDRLSREESDGKRLRENLKTKDDLLQALNEENRSLVQTLRKEEAAKSEFERAKVVAERTVKNIESDLLRLQDDTNSELERELTLEKAKLEKELVEVTEKNALLVSRLDWEREEKSHGEYQIRKMEHVIREMKNAYNELLDRFHSEREKDKKDDETQSRIEEMVSKNNEVLERITNASPARSALEAEPE